MTPALALYSSTDKYGQLSQKTNKRLATLLKDLKSWLIFLYPDIQDGKYFAFLRHLPCVLWGQTDFNLQKIPLSCQHMTSLPWYSMKTKKRRGETHLNPMAVFIVVLVTRYKKLSLMVIHFLTLITLFPILPN